MKYLILILALTSCMKKTSEHLQNEKQEELNKQAVTSVGMPSLTRFSEKKHLKDILELRDKEQATITYVRDMNGVLHKVCDSIGFGIPSSTQYTNPQKIDCSNAHCEVIQQADPNGLYSSNSEATWVLCLNPETKKISPIYLEDRITVSTFNLK